MKTVSFSIPCVTSFQHVRAPQERNTVELLVIQKMISVFDQLVPSSWRKLEAFSVVPGLTATNLALHNFQLKFAELKKAHTSELAGRMKDILVESAQAVRMDTDIAVQAYAHECFKLLKSSISTKHLFMDAVLGRLERSRSCQLLIGLVKFCREEEVIDRGARELLEQAVRLAQPNALLSVMGEVSGSLPINE